METIAPVTAPSRGQATRWLWESLKDDETAAKELRNCIWRWCVETMHITRKRTRRNQVEELRESIRPIIGKQCTKETDAFCQWSVDFAGQLNHNGAGVDTMANRYRFTQGARAVDIDVGTIHSAKGQTHMATLVIETFFKKHDMEVSSPLAARHKVWCRQTRGCGAT